METISAADYHDIAHVSGVRVAPDGETVAFCRRQPRDDEEDERTIHTAPADGDGEPSRLTAREGTDSQPRWSPSGDRLAFVSDRGEAGPQLRVLPVSGGESERVTNVSGGVESLAWSPDGTRIAFTQTTRPDEREAGQDIDSDDEYERETPDPQVHDRTVYRAAESYFDGGRSHVYVVDIETESVTRLTDGDRDFRFPAWASESELYYSVKTPVEDPDDSIAFDIERVPADGGEPTTVTTTTDGGPAVAVADDGRLAYPRTPPERWSMQQTDLCVYDPETDTETVVTADLDRTLHRARTYSWDDGDLYFTTPETGEVAIRHTTDGGLDTLTTDGEIGGVHAAGGTVAAVRATATHPADAFAYDTESEAGDENGRRRLSNVNEAYLESRAIAPVESLAIERDGHEIDGWLMLPPGARDGETYPLAVEVHGGPHVAWTGASLFHEFQTLAARGYAVFWSNPRGSVGYGDEFTKAIADDWGDVTMADVLAGADRAADHEQVDEDQQFLTGGSFGGYMTAWMVGHTDRFEGAVAQRGVYDLTSFYGSTDGAYQLVEGDFDALPWADAARLADHSPASYADQVETPTLVVHSENDYRVPICNGELLYRSLRRNGVGTRFVRYPREGHELSRSGEPGHVVDRIERIVRWFDGYSEHHDVSPALERERNDGLSVGEQDDE
ncbi:S9 family peptidase [Halobacteriales archaeon SW_8_65_20]|nr:MAG: S9 family peptidase [Halobacteriales archaeon SW_8_65_20]